MVDLKKAIPFQCILALWLFNHPGCIIQLGDSFFRFDIRTKMMMYCKPQNYCRTGWYRAKGMEQWLAKVCQLEEEGKL